MACVSDPLAGSAMTLFNQLIKCLPRAKHRHHQLEPDLVDRHAEHQHLKKKLYKTLFSKLNGPLSKKYTVANEPVRCKVRTKEQLLQVVFQLRLHRKFDRGQRLEKLVNNLPDLEDVQHSDLKAAIEVLFAFAGSKTTDAPTLGYAIPDLPLDRSKDAVVALPDGPLYHGDSKYLYRQEGHIKRYVHYSRELFEGLNGIFFLPLDAASAPQSPQAYDVNYKILAAEPGKDELGNGLFSVKPILGSTHERENRVTLFHGLTKSKTNSLDIKLTVPELPDTSNPDLLGLNVPHINEVSDDEGFHESSSTPSVAETPYNETDAFWEAVLNYKPNKHFTWETIGRHPRTTERPYLTEAGFQAVDELYKVLCHQASMLGGQPLRSKVILLDQRDLVRDTLHALIAVPSRTFLLDQSNQCLTVNTDICLSGTTPDSFHRLLKDFTVIGTDYLCLSQFSRQRAVDSTYKGGLVLQAFTTGVRRFLQYYQALVQLVPPESQNVTLLALKDMFRDLTDQLRYLSELCMCAQRGGASIPGEGDDPFPIGINLLSYLYQEALDCRNIQKYRLVLSLLRISCGPYLMFIQDWVFHGICHDFYNEFMITVNDTYQHNRDKHYWTQGYVLTTPNIEDNVPIFLHDMAYDIYVCGKSINLLKLCCPEHFLCNPDIKVPRVGLTFSPDELQQTVDRSREYLRHMQTLARLQTISREEKEIHTQEAKRALLAEARRTASQEFKRIQDEIKSATIAADEKKREIFQELKTQMQKDIVRRALAVETERHEDFERIEEVKRKERADVDAETELERQAREEVVEYYAKLSEEAGHREQRALWRIRRHKLDQHRSEMIRQEERLLQQSLRSMVEILPSSSDNVVKATESPHGVERDASLTVIPLLGVESSVKMDSVTESGVRTSSPPADALTLSKDSNTDSRLVNQLSASTEISLSKGGQKTSVGIEREAQIPVTGNLISLGDSMLQTGHSVNDDIESTLNIIQGDRKPDTQVVLPDGIATKSTKAPVNLLDISIGDFLPKDNTDEDFKDEEKDFINPEAQVEGVLVEIGSDLPSLSKVDNVSSAAGDILDEFLGVSSASQPKNGEGASKKVERRRKEWVRGDGKVTVFGHPSDSQMVLGKCYTDEQVQQENNVKVSDNQRTLEQEMGTSGEPDSQIVHGHASDSHFTEGHILSTEDQQPANKNVHGHASDSHFTTGQVVGKDDDQKQHSKNVHGHASDSIFTFGDGASEGAGHGPQQTNIHGHASDSHFTVGKGMDREGDQKQHRKNDHGHASDTNFTSEGAEHEPQLPNTHGHPSDSHFITGANVRALSSHSARDNVKPSLYGHCSDSTIGQVLHPSGDGMGGKQPANIHGHSSDSSAGQVLYPSPEGDNGEVRLRQHIVQDPHAIYSCSAGSTIQGIMYPTSQGQLLPSSGSNLASGAISKHSGHPSDSTAQRLLYGRSVLGGQPDRLVQMQESLLEPKGPVIWVGDGVEQFQDVFDMFDASPRTDLLASLDFVPLSTEIGDYGVQVSESDSLEVDEKISLPIIMKRSVTTPLLAQIGLVNQSILDYYLVELGIDKHFIALRSFLFLEDGEFGQSLCDQLFDKLAQRLRPAELLSPIVLNQVLPHAIQSSANHESAYAQLLGFSLKWLPPFFKPNAIDTFDCLELRYRVDWPFNIVITETCLIKYNKVFSFLLQLKRTSWVLRDIYFQLKRSATVNNADNSPQFRQLQLFRHEMQHFVSVMQGYVVNQVIHVSWQEFQRELRTNVHNLDDLHQKHAEYLNKAIFRCLLNKKAATLMKIITDILCLILKVRTQLISSSWVYDQASHSVVHPAFQTIRSSYLAFKDYSGFLYKVVAKLVTRGYQPHLEEFLLRLNFNDFYEES